MKTPWVEGVQYLEPLYKSLAEETGAHGRAPPRHLSLLIGGLNSPRTHPRYTLLTVSMESPSLWPQLIFQT